MSRYLTAQGFANSPPLLGDIVRIGAGRHAAHAWRRARLRAQSGRRLVMDAGPTDKRARRSRYHREAATASEADLLPTAKTLRLRSDAGWARCMPFLLARPTIRAFAPERPP